MTPLQIKSLRKRLKLSANEFAEELGFAGKNKALTVYRWENGDREPSNQTVMLIKQLAKRKLRFFVSKFGACGE